MILIFTDISHMYAENICVTVFFFGVARFRMCIGSGKPKNNCWMVGGRFIGVRE